ncbi:MAG TPA: fructose-bisphosphatase class II, partial [Thermoanaerobaculia bacterium]
GEIQTRFRFRSESERERAKKMCGIDDEEHVFTTDELASGDNLVFAASGVTEGELLKGVRFFGGGSRTSTLFMSLSRKLIRFVDSIDREQVTTPVRFL